ncbi:MAG: PAS domain S-box protein [Ignavibacteriaceae bacterium]|nr:PAS domain S-box protein [Ignavibacteriaceae bacterium]
MITDQKKFITGHSHLAETVKWLDAIIFSSNPDGSEYYFITEAVEKIIGITPDMIIQNPKVLLGFLLPEYVTLFRDFVAEVRKGNNKSIEYKIINARNEEVFLRHSAYPIFSEDRLVRVDGIIYDITREKTNSLLLQKSEERFRTLFETAEDLIFMLNSAGNFIMINTNGALSLEYSPNELLGRHFLELVDNKSKPEIAKSFQKILRTNKIETFEAELVTKYAKNIFFEINATSTKENGVIDSVLAIGRNITSRIRDREKYKELYNKLIEANRIISIERDRAKQKISVLEELNRLKNEFVSNVSHELRTPLASIIGFSETIHADQNLPEEMRIEFNSIILDEAKRLSRLINNVLEISQIEDGAIDLQKSQFNVVESLKSIIDASIPKSDEKEITLSINIADEEIAIFADRERIEQSIENVISNAIKFTPPKGRVTILAKKLFKEFELIISDTGIGIPKKDLPYVFQKFYKVSRPGDHTPGTGLGLVFVKNIIDLHKGLITVQSEEGKGTTVVIKLPLKNK